MKILIIQENSRKKESVHLRECNSLKFWFNALGVEAECWGKGHDNFVKPFYEFAEKFDFIFCLENYDNGWLPDLSKINAYKIFWSIDSHCALQEHLSLARLVNFNLHLNSTPSYMNHFEPYSEECLWFPNAIDQRYFRPKNVDKDTNVGFIGSMIADRSKVCPTLERLVGLKSYTNIIGEDYINLINSFHIGFNKSIADDINYRIFETTSCHVPLVTNYVPDLEKLFSLDDEIVVYNNLKEAIGAITWLFNDSQARNHVASMGYKRTIENHTYMHRCLTVIENLLPKTPMLHAVIKEDPELYKRYNDNYEKLKNSHDLYAKGWSANFYSGHRASNWALLDFIKNEKHDSLLDIGAYDGMFAKLAGKYKDTYIVEKNPWNEMWNLVGLDKQKINYPKPNCKIVTLMNVAHNWRLEDIVKTVVTYNGSIPEVIYLDSCLSNNHENNSQYCTPEIMNNYGFKLIHQTGRMIWKWKKQ